MALLRHCRMWVHLVGNPWTSSTNGNIFHFLFSLSWGPNVLIEGGQNTKFWKEMEEYCETGPRSHNYPQWNRNQHQELAKAWKRQKGMKHQKGKIAANKTINVGGCWKYILHSKKKKSEISETYSQVQRTQKCDVMWFRSKTLAMVSWCSTVYITLQDFSLAIPDLGRSCMPCFFCLEKLW